MGREHRACLETSVGLPFILNQHGQQISDLGVQLLCFFFHLGGVLVYSIDVPSLNTMLLPWVGGKILTALCTCGQRTPKGTTIRANRVFVAFPFRIALSFCRCLQASLILKVQTSVGRASCVRFTTTLFLRNRTRRDYSIHAPQVLTLEVRLFVETCGNLGGLEAVPKYRRGVEGGLL